MKPNNRQIYDTNWEKWTDMKQKLLITVDVEKDSDTHWRQRFPAEFTSITEGIPLYLRPIWDKFKINPIYFVSPEVLCDGDSCQVLKEEIKKNATIGAHLHAEHIEPHKIKFNGMHKDQFPFNDISDSLEYKKIRNLTRLINKRLHIKPRWYRAARFGADIKTIESIKKLGYRYDSSVTPGINWSRIGGPDFTQAPNRPYWISKISLETSSRKKDSIGIVEFPITICGKRMGILGKILPNSWLFYNWLRPTHMTFFEQKNLVNYLKSKNSKNFVIMFHSTEVMVGKTPYVRTKFMQRHFLNRLEKIIDFINK